VDTVGDRSGGVDSNRGYSFASTVVLWRPGLHVRGL
jgi:hypothetical protein